MLLNPLCGAHVYLYALYCMPLSHAESGCPSSSSSSSSSSFAMISCTCSKPYLLLPPQRARLSLAWRAATSRPQLPKITRRVSKPLAQSGNLREEPAEAPQHSPEGFWDTARSWLSYLPRAAVIGVLAAALFIGGALPADAARSGGRMGGSSFSSRPSSSYSRSYGSSYSGTSRSYGGYSGSSRSYGGGYSTGRLSTAPSVGFSSFFLSPFGFGYGYPAPMVGGFSLMSLIFWGVFAVVLLQVVQSVLRGGSAVDDDGAYYDGERVTVCKVQVGLMGSARQLQRDLERIASRANTESPEGLAYILQETVLALVRNPEYCLYGYSTGASMTGGDRAEARFNEWSMEERGKFEQETLVNVGGRKGRSALRRSPGVGPQELIVVTILVAAEGSFKLPKISSRAELRTALSKLGSLRAADLLAVEVLWTPEEEDDFFTLEDLAQDYPLLNTL